MAVIRSQNEIILSFIDFYRLVQPDLTVNPGSVNRDVFIEAPASQLALIYEELSAASAQQSFKLVSSSDLDKLASNFSIIRKQSTFASGVALLTFSSITVPLSINAGSLIFATNGSSFAVSTGIAIVLSSASFYKAVAAKYRDQLDSLGISDTYAVEVTVRSTTAGTQGNIGKYNLSRTQIAGVSNVTNLNVFNGGNDQESDAAFRARAISTFNGSSVGTSLGYLNTALSVTNVIDAVVVEPGDPLMTRDGTITVTNPDRSKTIVSEGTGGKVDVVVFGETNTNTSDSFIYRDKSNLSSPQNSKNDYVLGQIIADQSKTINRKRIDDLASGVVPQQPVSNIVSVSGTQSGSNFKPKSVDSYGRVSGNFELVKDAGAYAGSVFGFDTFHWISDKISGLLEDRIKGQFNGQDALAYSDVAEIPSVSQNIQITNENSTVTFDRSIIQLLHKPVTNVTRVFNANTGERYLVTNQNLDATPVNNTTGRVKISGNTLPSPTDVLQVDYSWVVSYDPFVDYNGFNDASFRSSQDSIDWGFSSFSEEVIEFKLDGSSNFYKGTTTLPISSVTSVQSFHQMRGKVSPVTSGIYSGRVAITVPNLLVNPEKILSAKKTYTYDEVYVTSENNGVILSTISVFGLDVVYNVTLILPTDTTAVMEEFITVLYNPTDVFATGLGNSNNSIVTIPASSFPLLPPSVFLVVRYVANNPTLLPTSIPALPFSKAGNGFSATNVGLEQAENNKLQHLNLIVKRTIGGQYYLDTGISALDKTITADGIISIVRTSDSVVFADNFHTVTIAVDVNNLYQILLSSYHLPSTNDRVIVFFYAKDLSRYQPVCYSSNLATFNITTLSAVGGHLVAPITGFFPEAVTFDILNAEDSTVLATVTDGVWGSNALTSTLFTFASIPDILQKRVRIYGSTNFYNNNTFNIDGFSTLISNAVGIGLDFVSVQPTNVSVVRLRDGKELYASSIDSTTVTIPDSAQAVATDSVAVILYDSSVVNYSPTKIAVTTTDQVLNPGTLTVYGDCLFKASDIVFTATRNGLKQDLAEALRVALGISSDTTIPSIEVKRIAKLEKVTVASDSTVLSTLVSYDLKNTRLKSAGPGMFQDLSIGSTEFVIPGTINNLGSSANQNGLKIGDKLRVTFYYSRKESENLSFVKNGTQYTNKVFSSVDKIYKSSGFTASNSTRLTIGSFNQPAINSRYKATYSYLAPKQNERITIAYNYNSLVSAATFAIESSRPVNADIIVRQAKSSTLDLTVNIVISSDYLNSQATVLQNVRDKLTSLLTATGLNQVVDEVDILNNITSVAGVNRARILFFNISGSVGSILKFQANKDEYYVPGKITINTETR
jgi:Baseplate J-like protein